MFDAEAGFDSLRSQVLEDGIAFGTDNPVNPGLEDAIRATLEHSHPSAIDPVAVVVLEQTPRQVADLRDLAQDLQLETGYDTVIVRTPHVAAAVSDHLTRHQIETAQRAMAAEPDYPEGLRVFLDTAQTASWNWGLVAAAILAGIVLVVAVTVRQAARAADR